MTTQTERVDVLAVPLNYVARRAGSERKCGRCGSAIPKGDTYYTFGERAVSYREAMHAGSMTVQRKRCADCAALARIGGDI